MVLSAASNPNTPRGPRFLAWTIPRRAPATWSSP